MRLIKFLCFLIGLLLSICSYSQELIEGEILSLSKLAFRESPIIKRGVYSIESSVADLQVQNGVFDYQYFASSSFNKTGYHLFDNDPRNIYINTLNTNVSTVQTGVQKVFRSSLRANASLGYNANSINYPVDRFGEVFLDNDNYIEHATSLRVSLSQPLLRGMGREITTASEKMQDLLIDNAEESFEFTNSNELLQVSLTYWNFLRAYKDLAVYKANEERVAKVFDITKELIKADKKPASELVQIQADLSSQKRLTEVAERVFYQAKMSLGLAVGLSEEESQLIGDPVNEFPTIEGSLYDEEIELSSLLNLAYQYRSDLDAVEVNKEVAEIQLDLAKNNLKPQLDASLNLGYGSESMGNGLGNAFSSFASSEGMNYTVGVGVSYDIPFRNNTAKGNVAKIQTLLNDVEVVNENLRRTIDLQLSTALNDLHRNVGIYKRAEEALEWNREAYENEQIKFQNGLTTLLNLILFQERLTYAELELLSAKQQFASTIATLRHQTGTLVHTWRI